MVNWTALNVGRETVGLDASWICFPCYYGIILLMTPTWKRLVVVEVGGFKAEAINTTSSDLHVVKSALASG